MKADKISIFDSCYEWECEENEENPMIIYANTHYLLNQIREEKMLKVEIGPRVMICGSSFSGKKTLCKILINYATKTGWKPIFVDLDINSNDIGINGCIGGAVIEEKYPENSEEFFEIKNKIMYWHGYYNYNQKKFYEEQIKVLNKMVNEKLETLKVKYLEKLKETYSETEVYKDLFALNEKNTFASGCIIKTPTYTEELGFYSYKIIVESSDADIILVLDHDGLFKKLRKEFPKKQIIKLNKSGGVVQIDEKYKTKQREIKLSHYFIGNMNQVKSKIKVIPYNLTKIYAITKSPAALDALPAGTTKEDFDRLRTKLIDPNDENLTKKVFGVLHLKALGENEESDPEKFMQKLINSSLACIVYVSDVNPVKKEMTVLFPFLENDSYDALNNYWLYSDIIWIR